MASKATQGTVGIVTGISIVLASIWEFLWVMLTGGQLPVPFEWQVEGSAVSAILTLIFLSPVLWTIAYLIGMAIALVLGGAVEGTIGATRLATRRREPPL